MLNQLQRTLDVLSQLNLKCKQEKNVEIVSKKEFDEQFENLEDFTKVISGMKILLKEFENCKNDNFRINEERLHKLHMKFCDYEWHICEVHELIKKMIGNFPEDYDK